MKVSILLAVLFANDTIRMMPMIVDYRRFASMQRAVDCT